MCQITRNDNSLCVGQRNSYSVPRLDSVKLCSKFSVELKKDKALQADVLLFSLNNPTTDIKSKVKCIKNDVNATDNRYEEGIEILEKMVVQSNLRGTSENLFDTEVMKENSCVLSSHKMNDITRTDSALIGKKESPTQINVKLVNKSSCRSTDKDAETVKNKQLPCDAIKPCNAFVKLMEDKVKHSVCNTGISVAGVKANSDASQIRTVRSDTVQYKQMLTEVIKPCSVFIKNLDNNTINSFCNVDIAAAKDELNNNTMKIRTIDADSCSKDLSVSPRKNHKISNSSNESNEQTSNFKSCCILIDKLPISECLEYMYPNVVSSYHSEKASYPCVKVEMENSASEAKSETLSSSYYSSSYITTSSTISDEVPIINATSKFTLTNEKSLKVPTKTSSVKSYSAFVQKISNKYMKFAVPLVKRAIKRQNNILKFNKKNNFKASLRSKLWFLQKKNMLSIFYKKHMDKIIEAFECKKWKRKSKKPKRFPKEVEKSLQLKKDLTFNSHKNIDETSSVSSEESQHNCILSDGLLPKCPLKTFNCCVLLKRTDVDEYLHQEKNVCSNHYNLSCSASSDIFPKCCCNNLITQNCFVLLKRLNPDKDLAGSNIVLNKNDLRNHFENLSKHARRSKYNRIDENVPLNSNINKLKRGRPLKMVNTSKLNVKKIKRKGKQCSLEETGNLNYDDNLICDSDYKCVQCRKSITSDYELYHHLCCGKRQKGYICDICERIFETIPGLKRHLNFHFQFINVPMINVQNEIR